MYLVMRKTDNKKFILKLGTEDASDLEKDRIRGESALLTAISSPYIVNC